MDETPNPTTRMGSPEPTGAGLGAPPQPGAVPPQPGAVPPPPPDAPPPPAPAPGWDQPNRHRQGDRGGRWLGVLGGIVLIAIGLWFFADRTLGIDLPDIHWSQLWPVILILIGIVVLFGAARRGRR